MKIAIALGGTDGGKSGTGVYVREVVPLLAAQAAARGNEVFCVGTQRDVEACASALPARASVVLGRTWDVPAASAALYLTGGASAVARANGADVLLLPVANRRCAMLSSLPTVAVVHDLAQAHVAGKYDPLRMAYLRHVLLRSMPRADVLVAISGATRDDLVRFAGVARERVRVVPNGVDLERFQPLSREHPSVLDARARHGLADPYLLYLARLEHPGKNHLRLLEAYASSPLQGRVKLALAGADWGAEAMIQERARALGIAADVVRLGFVPDADVAPLVGGASAVAMVGLHEGFGLPALEALAMGVPVVASNTGALPEVTGDLAASCDPLDVASIRAALERAVSDSSLHARIAIDGPRWAATRGWGETARGLLAACEAAATGATRKAA